MKSNKPPCGKWIFAAKIFGKHQGTGFHDALSLNNGKRGSYINLEDMNYLETLMSKCWNASDKIGF